MNATIRSGARLFRALYLPILLGGLIFSGRAAAPSKDRNSERPTADEVELHVPADQMEVVLKAFPKAVVLTRAQYETLLADVRAAKAVTPPEAVSPVRAAVVSERYEARVAGTALHGSGTIVVRCESEEWTHVTVGLPGMVLSEMKIEDDGKGTAAMVHAQKPGEASQPAQLLLRGAGVCTLKLSFSMPVGIHGGGGSFQLRGSGAPTSFQVRIPGTMRIESGLPCKVEHVQEATPVTVATVALVNADEQIVWRPSVAGSANQVAVRSHFASHYQVNAESVQTTHIVELDAGGLPLPKEQTFLIEPADAQRQILGIDGDVASWKAADGGRLLVVLSAPEAGRARLEVRMEQPSLAGQDAARVTLQKLRLSDAVHGTSALSGGVYIFCDASVRWRGADSKGYIELLMSARSSSPQVAQLEFYGRQNPIAIQVERAGRKFDADVDALVRFLSTGVEIERTLTLYQREGEFFGVRFSMPEDETFLSLLGADGQEPIFERKGRDFWVRWAAAKPQITLKLQSRKDPPDYQNLTEAGIEVPVGDLTVDGAAQVAGYVALSADAGLRLEALPDETLEVRDGRFTPVKGQMAWARGKRFALRVRVSRQVPEVSASFIGYALPEEGVLDLRGLLSVLVERAGIRSLRIAVPPALMDAIQFQGADIAERVREEAGWKLIFQKEILGDYPLQISGQVPFVNKAAEAGMGMRTFDVEVPVIAPRDVIEYRGTWAMEANTATQIAFTSKSMRELDARQPPELPGYVARHRVIGVFGWLGSEYSLALRGVRHESALTPSLIVDRQKLITLLSTSGAERTQVSASVRSAGAQFLDLWLPAGAEMLTARVAGEASKPVRGEKGIVRLRLPALRGGESALEVAFIYENQRSAMGLLGKSSASAHRFAAEVLSTEWELRMPGGFRFAEFQADQTPLTEMKSRTALEMVWASNPMNLIRIRERSASYEFSVDEPKSDFAALPESEATIGGFGRGTPMPRTSTAAKPMVMAPALRAPVAEPMPAELDAMKARGVQRFSSVDELRDAPVNGPAGGEKLAKEMRQKSNSPVAKGAIVGALLPLEFDLPTSTSQIRFSFDYAPQEISLMYEDARMRPRRMWLLGVFGFVACILMARGRPAFFSLCMVVFLTFLPLLWDRSLAAPCNAILVGWIVGIPVIILMRRLRIKPIIFTQPRVQPTMAVVALALAGLPLGAHGEPVAIESPQPFAIVPFDGNEHFDSAPGDKMYVPEQHFQKLWKAAKAGYNTKPVPAAPVAYTISSARYEASLEDRALRCVAKFDVHLFQDEWVKIPFAFSGVNVSGARVNGLPAIFDGDALRLEKRGRYQVEIAFDVARDTGQNHFRFDIPSAVLSQVELRLPNKRWTGRFQNTPGALERIEGDQRIVQVALGSAGKMDLEIVPSEEVARMAAPAVAQVEDVLSILGSAEHLESRVHFEFPGARQDQFVIHLDRSLAVISAEMEGMREWRLVRGAGESQLELYLHEAASGDAHVKLNLVRDGIDSVDRVYPVVRPKAARIESKRKISGIAGLNVETKPEASVRRVAKEGLAEIFEGEGQLSYRVSEKPATATAVAQLLYQITARKTELITSFELTKGSDEIHAVTFQVPPEWVVRNVGGANVSEWWQAAGKLQVRLRNPMEPRSALAIHVVREYSKAPTEVNLPPLILERFASVKGQAIVVAHKGMSAALKLANAREVDAATAATAFVVLSPMERKRAFEFDRMDFQASIHSAPVVPRSTVQWVMHAQAAEAFVGVSIKVQWSMRLGSLDLLRFTLPAALPEARVSGDEVRETRSRVENGVRLYEVRMQNDVVDSADFTVELDLLNLGMVTLPAMQFPGVDSVGGFIVADNASQGELATSSDYVTPATLAELPWAPVATNAASVFRTRPGWRVGMETKRLDLAATRDAFCQWLELSTAVRLDGTEWNKASWRVQNRSLQFLPVRLPHGSELMSVRVAGESVRADVGPVDGQPAILVPLLKTKPGDLSYDIEMVYRRQLQPLREKRVNVHFDDPETPGITVERTMWNVALPEGFYLADVEGNMQPSSKETSAVEKVKGEVEEIESLARIVEDDNNRLDMRMNAWGNLQVLNGRVQNSIPGASRNDSGVVNQERTRAAEKVAVAGKKLAITGKGKDYAEVPQSTGNGEAKTQWGRNLAVNKIKEEQLGQQNDLSKMDRYYFNDNVVVCQSGDTATSRRTAIMQKLQSIVIPKLEFNNATIHDAVDFLRQRSQALDNNPDENGKRGVDFVLMLEGLGGATQGAAAPANPGIPAIPGMEAAPPPAIGGAGLGEQPITIALQNIPLIEAVKYVTSLANLKFKVEENVVAIVPATENTQRMVTRLFDVPPGFIRRADAPNTNPGGGVGGGTANENSPDLSGRVDAREFLTGLGLNFPPNSTVTFLPSTSQLVINSTPEVVDLIEQFVEGPSQVDRTGGLTRSAAGQSRERQSDQSLAESNDMPQQQQQLSANFKGNNAGRSNRALQQYEGQLSQSEPAVNAYENAAGAFGGRIQPQRAEPAKALSKMKDSKREQAPADADKARNSVEHLAKASRTTLNVDFSMGGNVSHFQKLKSHAEIKAQVRSGSLLKKGYLWAGFFASLSLLLFIGSRGKGRRTAAPSH